MLIEMRLFNLLIDTYTDQPVLLLGDAQGRYTLPIPIGLSEAGAIASEMAAVSRAQPMTLDLLQATIERLGARLERVVIDGLHGTTFQAQLCLSRGAEQLSLQAQPGDALTLAVRCNTPILARRQVLDDALRACRGLLESLDPDWRQTATVTPRIPEALCGPGDEARGARTPSATLASASPGLGVATPSSQPHRMRDYLASLRREDFEYEI